MSANTYVRQFRVDIDVNDATRTRGGCLGAVPVLGPRDDDGAREPVDEAWWILGGLSEPVEHAERIASEGATVRTLASYHEIAATWALYTERGTPELTVLDAEAFDEPEARCAEAARGAALLEVEATFPRWTGAGDAAIDRLLAACLEGEARVVTGEVGRDPRTGAMHASAGTTIRHPRLPEMALSALDPDKVHVQCIGAQAA